MDLHVRSTRELQAYGAACVAAFASELGIVHSSILALVEHLLRVLTVKDLPGWESDGVALALTGRGDPLPDELTKEIPAFAVETFAHLVEVVVEIGLVNMYGADTEEPLQFAIAATDILRTSGVDIPSPDEFFGSSGVGVHGWDQPISDELYQKARRWCLERLSGTKKPHPG